MIKKIIPLLSLLLACGLITFASAQADPGIVALQNPIEGNPNLQVIIGNAIKVALGLLGSLALLMFVYGGFTWLTSAGQADRVKKGSMSMLYALIGMFVIFSAYGIITLIIEGVTR